MSNTQAIEILKGVKKENGIETIFENVSKFTKDSKLKIQVGKKLNKHSFACFRLLKIINKSYSNYFYKGSDRKYFRCGGPFYPCYNNSTLH